jgi:hypothetical protein
MLQMNKQWVAPFAVLGLCAALSACGGGDTPNTAPVATADAQTVNWNAGTELALIGNDSDTNGDPLTISSVTTPTHGTAVLAAGKVTYTPTSGYVGTDSLSYTISDGKGGTATATTTLTVQAAMKLKGRAFDAPLANAVVTATIGGKTFTTTADANGNYELPVTSDTLNQFISLTAAGVGAQSTVKLTSLVGEVNAVASSLASDGTVSAANAATLNVTHVSTALAALATAANGGTAPSTQAALTSSTAQVGADGLLQMAAVIKLVADSGVPLPAGVADTAALVNNASTYNTFAQGQVQNNAAALQAATTAVTQDPNLAVTPPATIASTSTRVYYIGRGCCSLSALEVTLKPDGSATVLDESLHAASWKVANGVTQLTYSTPAVSYGLSSGTFNGQQVNITVTTTGISIRQLTGSTNAGVATLSSTGTVHYDHNESPDEVNTDTGTSYVFTDESQLVAPSATELAGSTFAGIPTPEINPYGQNQDTLILNADGTGKLQRSGTTFTWTLSSGKLVLTYSPSLKQTLVRLSQANDGEERWLVRYTATSNGVSQDTSLQDALVVKTTVGLTFNADTGANKWRSYVNAGVVSNSSFFLVLNADKQGWGESDYLDGSVSKASPVAWRVENGQLIMPTYWLPTNMEGSACPTGVQCGLSRERSWTKLAVSGTKVFVMEHLWIYGGLDQYRINRYEATSPATPQSAAQAKAASYQVFPLAGGRK